MTAIVVPRGAEERAVRRGAPAATIVAIRAGTGATALPPFPDGLAVVMGLCGALRGRRVGDAIVYGSVVDGNGQCNFDDDHIAAIQAALPGVPVVRACTAGHVVTTRAERASLAAAYDADVVDMEGTHLARTLRERGVPAVMVRVVSDDPRYDLPPIGAAFGPSGAIRPLHLAGAFAGHPVAAARFIGDVRRALNVLAQTAAAISSPAA